MTCQNNSFWPTNRHEIDGILFIHKCYLGMRLKRIIQSECARSAIPILTAELRDDDYAERFWSKKSGDLYSCSSSDCFRIHFYD